MRWLFLFLSLMCFVFGGLTFYGNPALPAQAVEVSIDEAKAKLESRKAYISLSAGIDLESRIYSTDVVRPVYCLKSTNRVHPISVIDAIGQNNLKDYVGASVRVSGRTALGGVKMQMVENTVGETKVISQRQLSPLEGSDGKLWVLTNRRVGDQSAGGVDGESVFEGVLTRFVDFDKNLESYIENYSLSKIQKYLNKDKKYKITEETYLIILGLENTRDNLFYCPVEGSNFVLYAAMTEQLAKAPPNPLVGIMESWDTNEEGDLGAILNQTPPEKIGVIRHGWTADMYNKGNSNSVKSNIFFGVVFLLISVFCFLRGKLKKK